jgi:hypothetical protein
MIRAFVRAVRVKLAGWLFGWALWTDPGSDDEMPVWASNCDVFDVGQPERMLVQLLPATSELGFSWEGSGVGWTITLAELLTVFERSGYVDPFKGECSPHAKAPDAQGQEAKPGRQKTASQAGLEGRRDA